MMLNIWEKYKKFPNFENSHYTIFLSNPLGNNNNNNVLILLVISS